MGRKIPGKKHRGVKDPLEQQAIRNERLKNVINAPPGNPDVQEIPKSVIEMNRLRQLVKDGEFKKKKPSIKRENHASQFSGFGPQLPGMVQKDKRLPKVKQMVGETNASFRKRIHVATEDILDEASIEAKFKLRINRNNDGSIENITCDEKFQNKNSKNNRGIKRKSNVIESEKRVKLNKKQRLKLKKAQKNSEKSENIIEIKTDHVKFGEVVHEPPHLRARPRGTKALSFDKPGGRNLLLNAIMSTPNSKKKDKLSAVQQKRIDQRRIDVVNAYRQYKSSKLKKMTC